MSLDLTVPIYILMVLLVAMSVYAIVGASLISGAIGLALASVMLSATLFGLDSPLAAVFELSVCAGLITVVIVSAISLTERHSKDELRLLAKERIKRYWPLPLIVIGCAVALLTAKVDLQLALPVFGGKPVLAVREVMWTQRTADLFGQIIIILTGIFGVVVLFKEHTSAKPKSGD